MVAGENTLSQNQKKFQRAKNFAKALKASGGNAWHPFTPLPDDIPADLVPGCTLQAVIGTGGMGAVYLARQDALDRLVAVKLLNPSLASNPTFMARLQQEAQIMATLTHPNLVGCHDIIVSRNGACLLMEYIPGHMNGRNLVKLLGPMPERYVTIVMLEVAKGLAYAYEKGFTHRDVKPDNILFAFQGNRPPNSYQELFEAPDARIALCDFGIASTNDQREFVNEGNDDAARPALGSPLYMAPEQAIMPEEVDCRSDIYSLGATAYFLLTGQPPFPGKTMEEVLEQKSQQNHPLPVPPPLFPPVEPELAKVILKMGACRQDERFADYHALLPKLQEIAAPYTSTLTFRIFTLHYRRFLKRALLIATALALLMIGGLYGYTWWMEHYEDRQIAATVNLANWNGALSTWGQQFDGGTPILVGSSNAGPITLKAPLQNGDFLRLALSFQDIGSVILHVHEAGKPENIYARITCHRQTEGNVVRLDSPNFRRADLQLTEVPTTPLLPDATNTWIHLRIQFNNGNCVVWDRETPLGICHFSPASNTSKAQFTITKIHCNRLLFSNIAHINAKYASRMHNEDAPQGLPIFPPSHPED